MPQAELRRRLRGSDAMFLYFEKKELPLHIGSVAVLDGPFEADIEEILAARLPEIPRYRQRVIFSPSNLTHPTWVDDPDFDVKNHVKRVRLDPPGSHQQLSELAGSLFTPLMDRNKPLWDFTIVDGLEGGRSGLILRVHHCLVDGVAGIDLCNVIFDAAREPRKVAAEPEPFHPGPIPNQQKILVEGLAGFWSDAAERLIGSELAVIRIAQAFLGDGGGDSLKKLLALAPELLFPAETLPFNVPCSGERGYCWTRFPFAESHAIRAALGGTINDVILTTMAGAVSRYVTAHREPVKGRFARLLVPVNVRTEASRGSMGNEISGIPFSVPLGIDDPIQRFHEVAARSVAVKTARVADMLTLIGTWLGWTPPALQYSLAGLSFMPQPLRIVNSVCTNVPGPMAPLYSGGRELLEYYPCVPCGADIGLSVAVASYNRHLHYGITFDMQAAPDGELFRDFLAESYQELRNRAGVPSMEVPAPAKASIRVEEPVQQTPESKKPAAVAPEPVSAVPDAVATAPEPVVETPEPVIAAAPSAKVAEPATSKASHAQPTVRTEAPRKTRRSRKATRSKATAGGGASS